MLFSCVGLLFKGGMPLWGISCTVLAALSGITYQKLYRQQKADIHALSLLLFGIALNSAFLLLLSFWMPDSESLYFFQNSWMLLGILSPATLIFGLLIQDQQARLHNPKFSQAFQPQWSDTEQRIAAIAFESQQGLVITNANAKILRANQAFTKITGFTAEEIIGQSIRVLSSGTHPPSFYQNMWSSIQQEGCWQGEISNRRKNGDIYTAWLSISAVRNEAGQITHYIGAQTDISVHKEAQNKIHHLAYYDPLTGLPNRRLLFERLQQAIAHCATQRYYGALMIFDLDNFKNINDLHGHHTGDQFLCEVASRLQAQVRNSDTVARLGGDEFVVVLEGFKADRHENRVRIEQFGQRILESLSTPYQLGDLQVHSSASIGVVMFRDCATDNLSSEAEDLMRHADIAMYEAKNAGKNGLRFFDPHMQEVLNTRLDLENELNQALLEQQFILYFQPQFDVHKNLLGAEAFVRWKHPTQGLLKPGQFMEVARRMGFIQKLDQHILQQACQQLALWANDPYLSNMVLGVNISATLLYQPDFAEQLLTLLKQQGANPHRLKLELTEALLLADMPTASQHMHRLRAEGVSFSIDDFGTGYSSMTHLHSLPLDQLKIDQSLVENLATDSNKQAIVRTICGLASSLGLEVLAEGVEHTEQRQHLERLGCHRFQGYLFGHPVNSLEFEYLTHNEAWPCMGRSGGTKAPPQHTILETPLSGFC